MLSDEIRAIVDSAMGSDDNHNTLRLAYLLENSCFTRSNSAVDNEYPRYLSPHLIKNRLSIEQQREIVESVTERIINGKNVKAPGSLIWAIGRARGLASVYAILDLVQNHLEKFNMGDIYQLFIALDNVLFFDGDSDVVQVYFRQHNPTPILEKYLTIDVQQYEDRTVWGIPELAENIISKIREFSAK